MISQAVQLFLLEKMPHMMARTDDSRAGRFDPRKYIIIKPSDQSLHYKSVLSKFEIDLPENPLQYTSMLKHRQKKEEYRVKQSEHKKCCRIRN